MNNPSSSVISAIHNTDVTPQTELSYSGLSERWHPLDRRRSVTSNAGDLTPTVECFADFNGYTDDFMIEESSHGNHENEGLSMEEDTGSVTSSPSMFSSPTLSSGSWSTTSEADSYNGDDPPNYELYPIDRAKVSAPPYLTSGIHIKEQDFDTLSSIIPSKQQGAFNCAECEILCDTFKKLEQHGKHSKHLPFQCPYCCRLLPRRDTFKRHLDSHASRLELRCEQCASDGIQKQFKRRDHLTQHMRKFHSYYSPEDRQKEALLNMVNGLGDVLVDDGGLDAEALKPRIDELAPRTVKPLLQGIASYIERTVQLKGERRCD